MFKADDIIEHSDKQLFRATLRSDHCLDELLPSRKNYFDRNLRIRKKGNGLELPLAKTERFKSSFVMRCVYISLCLVDILHYCTLSSTCLIIWLILLFVSFFFHLL